MTAQAVVETSAATTITSAAFGKGDQETTEATSAPAKKPLMPMIAPRAREFTETSPTSC